MIRINLLPYDLRPIKRTPIPYIIVIGLFLTAVVYGMLFFFSLFAEVNRQHSKIDAQKSELSRLAAIVEEYDKLTVQKEKLSTKIETIQEIIEDRVVWSKQLEQLATLTPLNIWYKKIRLVWKMDSIIIPKVDKKTGKPAMDKNGAPATEKKQVRKPFLEISGYVATDPKTGERDINPLTQALQSDPDFAARYDLHNTLLEDVELEAYGKVRSFTLEYKIGEQQRTAVATKEEAKAEPVKEGAKK